MRHLLFCVLATLSWPLPAQDAASPKRDCPESASAQAKAPRKAPPKRRAVTQQILTMPAAPAPPPQLRPPPLQVPATPVPGVATPPTPAQCGAGGCTLPNASQAAGQ